MKKKNKYKIPIKIEYIVFTRYKLQDFFMGNNLTKSNYMVRRRDLQCIQCVY